jgi:glycosyltransferase involved in cell wall biosynthesis
MAAGLPVIASDWDGLRDTVTSEVGIRVPTLSAGVAHSDKIFRHHHLGLGDFNQYSAKLAALTEINMPSLIEALIALAQNDTMQKKWGKCFKTRTNDS